MIFVATGLVDIFSITSKGGNGQLLGERTD